jgi:RHS repeat-associated protein
LSTGTGFSAPQLWVAAYGAASGWTDNNTRPRILADVNGDGRPDIVGFGSDGVYVSLNTGSGFSASQRWVDDFDPINGWTDNNTYPRVLADVNGDGKADVVGFGGAGTWISYSTGNGFTTPQLVVGDFGTDDGWTDNNTYPRVLVDVNGDGKADIFGFGGAGVWVAFSTGAGFTAPQLMVGNFGTDDGWTDNNIYPRMLVDVNGDGSADIVGFGGGGVWVAFSTGNGFTTADQLIQDYGVDVGGWANNNTYPRMFTDINGDGKADIVGFGGGGVKVSTSTAPFPDLLTSIMNGLNAQISVTYKPLTDGTVYTKDNNSLYPSLDNQAATYIVSRYTNSNGIGGINTTTYLYGGLKYHITADGSLGFRWLRTTDPAGFVTTNYYNQTLNGAEGTLASSVTTYGSVTVKSVTNTWTPNALPLCNYNCTFAFLASTVQQTTDLNGASFPTTTTAYSNPDAYWNPQTIVASNSADGYKKTISTVYNNDTVNWTLGQVTQSQVTADATGQPSQTRTSSFTYDGAGRLASETIEPNSPTLKLSTTYGYDIFGNKTSKTVSGSDIVTQTDSQTFDARGQYLKTKTNTAGQAETYNSYDSYGSLTSLTGPNGITTTWSYDGFGRKIGEIRADGTTTTVYYLCGDNSSPILPATCPVGVGTAIQVKNSGAGDTWTYYDILGRSIRTARNGFGGAWAYTDTIYDSLGHTASASQPDFSSPPVYRATYSYDALGRVLTATAPGNRVTTTIYNGLTTTVTNPKSQTFTTIKNSQGQVAQASDAGGSTSFLYDAFGNLIRQTDVAGNITTLTYDIRGRKIALNDPDMGAWTYAYNVLNELISQKDAKNQTTTMTYDKLGRITSRVLPNGEGTSTWTYDTATKGVGKLASVSNGNATETYTYDNLGRPNTDTTSIGGITYTVTTTYDTSGRVGTVTYPETGFKLSYVYDPYLYGFIKQVKNASSGVSYWKINTGGVDAHNRVINETYGNGLTSQHQYDAVVGDLMSIKTGTTASPTSVQNLSYTYDSLDNLLTRTDTIQNFTETFGYDTLNRVTSVSGPAPKTYQYVPNGNVTYKSDVGTYTYPTNGIRPHAVSSVSGTINTSYSYDANGNMLTGNGRTITYTSFNKPKTIAVGSTTSTLTYDANLNRIIKSNSSGTTIYIGKLYERVTSGTTTTQKHYIYAGSVLVGVYSKVSNGTTNTRYFHTDHLGSVSVITNETGSVVQSLSYDTWGKRRNANGTDAVSITAQTTRGFTRHENDDEVGLVNMNAREYDYVLGRFVTPDTIVQYPLSSQGVNRYTYVNNNPLSFTDPSGHFSFSIGGVSVSVGSGGVSVSVGSVSVSVGPGGTSISTGSSSIGVGNLVGTVSDGIHRLGEWVGRASTNVVSNLSQVKYVGGLLTTGYLSSPMFGTTYGATTGDWASVGRATVTAGILAAAVYAGGLTSQAYSSPVLSGAQGLVYTGPTLSAAQYVGANALIAFDATFAVAKVNGASTREAWHAGLAAAKVSIPFTLVDIAAINMRADQVEQSLRDSKNRTKVSAGNRGDNFGLAGCRYPCKGSLAGGIQGQQGSLLGIPYDAGGIGDFIAEAGAGPHDYLSQWMYDSVGDLAPFYQSGIGSYLGDIASYALLVPSIPISTASVLAPYSGTLYSDRYMDYGF